MPLIRNGLDGRLFQLLCLGDRRRWEVRVQSTLDHRAARQFIQINRSHPFHL
jgi:hypothetical protein